MSNSFTSIIAEALSKVVLRKTEFNAICKCRVRNYTNLAQACGNCGGFVTMKRSAMVKARRLRREAREKSLA